MEGMPLQATLNGNDLWLSYWVSQTPTPAQLPYHRQATQLHVQQQQQQQYSPAVGEPFPTTFRPDGKNGTHAVGATHASGSLGLLLAAFGKLDPEVRFYLGVLMAIAGANTVFTLVSGAVRGWTRMVVVLNPQNNGKKKLER